jgi:hypothetical protein
MVVRFLHLSKAIGIESEIVDLLQDPVPKAVFASYYFAQAGGII